MPIPSVPSTSNIRCNIDSDRTELNVVGQLGSRELSLRFTHKRNRDECIVPAKEF